MADFWLVCETDNKDLRRQLAPPGPITIGREPSCGIVLSDGGVSRQHALLQWNPPTTQEPGHWRIKDKGSTGGTFVNGMRLETERTLALQHGDHIEIAPWKFDFINQESPINMSRTVVMSGDKDNSLESSRIERVRISSPSTFAHNQLLLLLDSSAAIHKATDESSVYQALVHAAAKSSQFENVAFVRATGQGEAVEVLAQVGNIQDPGGKTRMSRTMLRQARQGPVVAKANEAVEGGGIAMSLQGMNVRCAICIPVELSGMLFGFLYLDDRKQCDDAMLTITASVAGTVADTAAQTLKNIQQAAMVQRLERDQKETFEGITHALIKSIDGKDPYTKDHCKHVAEFAKLLAQAANLSEAEIEKITFCGIMHDLGKMFVKEEVLRKVERLTDEEFAQIKLHPERGYEILHDIPQMHDVLPGVLEHHEKWDGSGYPRKLVGKQISVLGRIICIADCFDAMTSNRAYRPARNVAQALAEIERCLGTHFDPELGKVFLSIPIEKLEERVAKHNHFKDPA